MKLYPHIVLTTALAALAVPAFCQKPSPFPEPQPSPDVTQSLAGQAADLDYQAAKMALDAKTLVAEKAITEGRIDALKAQAAAMADQFFYSPDIKENLSQLTPEGINDMKAAAMEMADQAKMAFLQAPVPPVPPRAPKGAIGPFRVKDDAYNAGTRALDELSLIHI